ncbi:MAG: hypothetical protein GTO05_19415 [Gemmatimonadales bacterium]|nr:hypothetical protein [Gemmatimonadales bacterium]
MFGMVTLDVVIGLAFVYLVLSLICSAMQELVAVLLSLRSATLREGIDNLLEDENLKDANGAVRNLADDVYQHALVRNLSKKGKDPSYIPARSFALALLDVLKDPASGRGALTEAKDTVDKLPSGRLKEALGALIDSAQGDIEKVRENIEGWFDDAMDRVSGWYKRTARRWMLGIAFGLAVIFNVDSIEVAKGLWQEPTLRAAVVQNADEFVAAGDQSAEATIRELHQELDELALPIGWPARWGFSLEDVGLFLLALVGWALTALAVSLGAPFWFDGLGRLLNIRAAGQRPAKAAAA